MGAKKSLPWAPGSPAHAGIDPFSTGKLDIPPRFPRTRGDRPVEIGINGQPLLVPPHTRG